jgi:hypothetical protein
MAKKKPTQPKNFVPIRPKGEGTIPMKDILAVVEKVFRERESGKKRAGSKSRARPPSPNTTRASSSTARSTTPTGRCFKLSFSPSSTAASQRVVRWKSKTPGRRGPRRSSG